MCHLQPKQKFEYLCLQWDSEELRVMLSVDKITNFRRPGSIPNLSLRTAQTFLGSCELGRIHPLMIPCFCTEQRDQRVGEVVAGTVES